MEILKTHRKKENAPTRPFLNLTAKQYRVEFMIIAEEIIAEQSPSKKGFEINDDNREVINQWFYYLIGDKKRFTGDINKGIMIVGPYGTGKTTMVKIISRIVMKYAQKVFHITSCVNLPDNVKHHGIDFYQFRPLILDEIGRESKVVKDFGTERKLLPEILSIRYNTRAWTFGTSNLNYNDLGELYGGYIQERMLELFNFIELKGKSFRE